MSSGTTSPDAPDVMMLPKEIRQLFDRAFNYSSSTAVQSATISKDQVLRNGRVLLEHCIAGT